MAEFEKAKKPTPRKYEAGKSYKWEPEDKFIINGEQFSLIMQALRKTSEDPNYNRIVTQYEAAKEIQKIFEEAVEAGVIVEQEPQVVQMQPWQPETE